MIAACGFETWAPGVGRFSFTRGLIDELTRWSHNVTLSVATLHSKLLTYVKGRRRFEPSTPYEERKTPIYVQLSNASGRKSITLSPLRTTASSSYELAGSLVQEEHSSISSAMSGDGQSSSNLGSSQTSQSSLGQMWPDEDFQHPRVLLSLQLEEDQRMLTTEWIEWVKSVPAIVKYTRIQGIYRSTSMLLLLTMPLALWDLLPKDPAATFIAFIQSKNLVQDEFPSLTASMNLTTFSVAKPVRENSAREIASIQSSWTLQGDQRDNRARILRRLQDFDTKILVDYSAAMSEIDWTNVRQAVTDIVLTVIKETRDGVAVRFSDPLVSRRLNNILKSVEDVANLSNKVFLGGPGHLEEALHRVLLEHFVLHQLRRTGEVIHGLNLIVLAKVESLRGSGVGHVLREVSMKFATLKALTYAVGVKFVQIRNGPLEHNFRREIEDLSSKLYQESGLVSGSSKILNTPADASYRSWMWCLGSKEMRTTSLIRFF